MGEPGLKYDFADRRSFAVLVPGSSGNVGKLPKACRRARAIGRESPRASPLRILSSIFKIQVRELFSTPSAFKRMAIAEFDTSMRPSRFRPPALRSHSMASAATQVSHAQPTKQSHSPQACFQDEETFIATHQKDAERSDPCTISPMDDMIVCSAASAGQDSQCHLAYSWA